MKALLGVVAVLVGVIIVGAGVLAVCVTHGVRTMGYAKPGRFWIWWKTRQ